MTEVLKRNPGEMSFMQVSSMSDLSIPEEGSQIRFITTAKINMIDFFDFLKSFGFGNLEEVYISNSSIDKKAVSKIEEMISTGFVKKIYCQINETEEGRKPEIIKAFKDLSGSNCTTALNRVHAKVIAVKAGGKYLVLEGSGNISTNAEIEQYCFFNSEESYNFHKNWIMGNENEKAFSALIQSCTESVQELFNPSGKKLEELNSLIMEKFGEKMG